MSQKQKYQQYLSSPQWHQLRAQARNRAGNKCEFCGGSPDHVHHVRYPKRYKDDHVDNLVVACEVCHSKLHGVREEIYIDDWIGTATKLELVNGTLMVHMVFDPMPEEFRDPSPLADYARRTRHEYSEKILTQFDGEYFEEGKTYEKVLPVDHKIFDDKSNWTVNDFLSEAIGYLDCADIKPIVDKSTAGEVLIEWFSLGPIPCAFRR